MTQRADWNALFDALAAEHVSLAEQVSEAISARLLSYRPIAGEELTSAVGIQIEFVLRSARVAHATTGGLAELSAIGESRARQAIPVDDMLRAWRIGMQVVVARAREIGGQLSISDGSLLDFVESMFASSDVAMVVVAGAHRQAELALARRDQERRAVFVRGLLLGTLPPAEVGPQAIVHNIDPTREFVTIRAHAGPDVDQRAFQRALGFSLAGSRGEGICTLIEGDLAGFLPVAPTAAVGGVVGIGPARQLERLAESFRLATRALITAQGFGLDGIHDVSTLGLRAAIVTDADVGDALRTRYVEPLTSEASGQELISSLRAYFESGMHFERAAARLFVHQNTLRYRIARFESITGVSLRDPRVAFEVWWALEWHVVSAEPKRPGAGFGAGSMREPPISEPSP
jgi:hypothetical protein